MAPKQQALPARYTDAEGRRVAALHVLTMESSFEFIGGWGLVRPGNLNGSCVRSV